MLLWDAAATKTVAELIMYISGPGPGDSPLTRELSLRRVLTVMEQPLRPGPGEPVIRAVGNRLESRVYIICVFVATQWPL